MNKKLIIGCIGIVFMLVSITMVSALGTKTTEKKESPLYKFRAEQNIYEKIQYLKTKFLTGRIFFLQNHLMKNSEDCDVREIIPNKTHNGGYTCDHTCQNGPSCVATSCSDCRTEKCELDDSIMNLVEGKYPSVYPYRPCK